MDLIERLKADANRIGVLFTAIETLKDSEQIKEFYQGYIVYLKEYGKSLLVARDPKEAATRNIVYILGEYGKQTSSRWRKALPEINPYYKEFYKPYSTKLKRLIGK